MKFCDAFNYLLGYIFIRFGSKVEKIAGISIGTNCSPLVAGMVLCFYERDFMLSLSEYNQAGVFEAFNFTTRYIEDGLLILNKW